MAINLFGVTPESLRSEYLPGSSPFSDATRPTDTDVATMIGRLAAVVSASLASIGVAPEGIEAESFPIAHGWLADTLTLGSFVRVARVSSLGLDADTVKAWAGEFEDRLRLLREEPAACIPDAYDGLLGGGGEVRSHVSGDKPAVEPRFTVDAEG